MRNKVNHQLEISERKYYQSQFLECGNDSAKMWKLINTLTNSQVKTILIQTNYVTQYIHNTQEIQKRWLIYLMTTL